MGPSSAICLGLVVGLIGSYGSSARHISPRASLVPMRGMPMTTQLTFDKIFNSLDRAEYMLNQYINRQDVTRNQMIYEFAKIRKFRRILSKIPETSRKVFLMKLQLMSNVDYFISRLLGALGITDDYDY